MNLEKFVEALTESEKTELLRILSSSRSRIKVGDWLNETEGLSERGRNALRFSTLKDRYMDEITSRDLLKVRNFGMVSLEEVQKLYPLKR